jgi:hypothetical protein
MSYTVVVPDLHGRQDLLGLLLTAMSHLSQKTIKTTCIFDQIMLTFTPNQYNI